MATTIDWEKITRDGSEGVVHGLRRTKTIDDKFNEETFENVEEVLVQEFWQDDIDNEIASIDERIASLEAVKAKKEAKKAGLTAKWQSL